MRFLSNFECKIIFVCSNNFWHQQDSNSLFNNRHWQRNRSKLELQYQLHVLFLLQCFFAHLKSRQSEVQCGKAVSQSNLPTANSNGPKKLNNDHIAMVTCGVINTMPVHARAATVPDSSPVVSKLSLLINYLLGKRLGYARGGRFQSSTPNTNNDRRLGMFFSQFSTVHLPWLSKTT